jgi:hypothetical protein
MLDGNKSFLEKLGWFGIAVLAYVGIPVATLLIVAGILYGTYKIVGIP